MLVSVFAQIKSRIKNVLGWKKPVILGCVVAFFISIFIICYCVPNPMDDSPDQSICELTSTLSADDITEIYSNIYDNDVRVTGLHIGAYPELLSEFVSILNEIPEDEFVLTNGYLREPNIHIFYKTEGLNGYELLLTYCNGVTSFTTDSFSKYSAGTNKQWKTNNVALSNFMKKVIEIIEDDEPHIINTVYASSPKNENDEWIIETYHEMSDGTYRTAEYSYAYKLVLTGKVSPSAAGYSTYTILSNDKDITFEQAWKASGLSSSLYDYFNPKDAIIVSSK